MVSVFTCAKSTPIVRKRRYAGMAVVPGKIFDRPTSHSGMAFIGHDTPLRNSAMGERNIINTMADSRCFRKVDKPMPKKITASINGNSSIRISVMLPLSG